MQNVQTQQFSNPQNNMKKNSTQIRILVTGGAGFLGSHLCERLVLEGCDVICVDNYFTGSKDNISHLLNKPNFELLRHDVTFPLYVEVDQIYNLACPASPVHYQYDPVQTTKTSVHGAINMLGLAKRTGARVFRPQRARFMAILKCIRSQKVTGAKSIRLVFALVMTKVNAVLRPCFSTITASTI
jgi:FlaA1/EpsC-like NDP-sugar epimerase